MKEKIHKGIEGWIMEEDLPPRANLKVLKGFDPYEGMDEEEIEAYHDFIHWAVAQEHAVLLSIPKEQNKEDFWQIELDAFGNDISAFNTMDFQRLHPDSFNKYAYKLKKIYERVQDLALLHSCIIHEDRKKNIHQRYKNLVEKEFRDRAVMLLETYRKYPHLVNKEQLFERIAEQNSKVKKCNEIWQKIAYQE